jgi:hypothetical protein
MPFVHGLVRTRASGREGWCAPVELGEATPHYVSFAIPVDEVLGFFDRYTCETVVTDKGDKTTESHDLMRQGDDSFMVRLGESEVWFTVRPVSKGDRRLPYVGKLGHEDFRHSFTEIEPVDPRVLDKLYNNEHLIIIGCEPFAHYSGITTPARKA